MRPITKGKLFAVSFSLAFLLAPAVWAGFGIHRVKSRYVDVKIDGKPVARYMYAYDTSSDKRHHETYKTYLHVLDPETGKPITKGPGGKYTHHRGIFIGWRAVTVEGKSYDLWHMSGGDLVHQKFLKLEATGNHATISSLVHWNNKKGEPLLVEKRTMKFRRPPSEDGIVMIDFVSTLRPAGAEVNLRGDPEHAGVQYRPHNEVAENNSATYVFPEESINRNNVKKERDLPWAAETYTLGDQAYSVQHMNHPENPKGTRYSAYRKYGRFGAFFEKKIPKGDSLTVRYRILVKKGELPKREKLKEYYEEFSKLRGLKPPEGLKQRLQR